MLAVFSVAKCGKGKDQLQSIPGSISLPECVPELTQA